MARIRELPQDLVDKIAAGEVIERPASVVKELLENALDAGARRIEVAIEEGGLRLVRITDDGDGIEPDELPLAIKSHATSKISTQDDLFAIRSLGFRGEALASIAAVSNLTIRSRARGREAGAELKVAGGRREPVTPAGVPQGTSIEVADLFWNIPARRAFVGAARAELRAVMVEVRRQALAASAVAFRVTSDGSVALDAPATDEPRERLAQLFGRDLAQDMVAVPITRDDAVAIRGYVTPVDRSRGDSQQQYFVLNGRCVRDPTLLAAVRQSYANLLPPRRHASAVLWLDLPPADVDVNVHPQKAEVRFRQDREVFHAVVRALRGALHRGGLVAELPLPRRLEVAAGGGPSGSSAVALAPPPLDPAPLFARPLQPAQTASGPAAQAAEASGIGQFFQLHRRYVVEETPAGLRILDPHALHERILYEEILARLSAGRLESQRFLFPLVVRVSPLQLGALEGRATTLESLGFEVTPFGADSLAVHAAPRLLAADRAQEALLALLEDDACDPVQADEVGAGGEAARLLHELAATLACRSAVRFGEPLGDAQVAELLRRRAEVKNGHCCPHGRPTALALSLDEFDRRFGRQGAGSQGHQASPR